MFFVSPDQSILDDGYEMQTAPAYGLNKDQTRYELDPEYAFQLTRRWLSEKKSRFPLGNAVARVTRAVGIPSSECGPCEHRKEVLNRLGDQAVELASQVGKKWWWAR